MSASPDLVARIAERDREIIRLRAEVARLREERDRLAQQVLIQQAPPRRRGVW